MLGCSQIANSNLSFRRGRLKTFLAGLVVSADAFLSNDRSSNVIL